MSRSATGWKCFRKLECASGEFTGYRNTVLHAEFGMEHSRSSTGVDRTRRVASLVQRELTQIMLKELSDPRIGMVTITEIEMSKDLKTAKVFVFGSGPGQELQESVNTLNHAAPYIRKLLGNRLKMKSTPAVQFHSDQFLEHGEHMMKLIDKVSAVKKES